MSHQYMQPKNYRSRQQAVPQKAKQGLPPAPIRLLAVCQDPGADAALGLHQDLHLNGKKYLDPDPDPDPDPNSVRLKRALQLHKA